MRPSFRHCLLAGLVSTASLALRAHAGAPSDLAQLEFFEKKIRPVLVESCYECHSAESKKVKGGLLLDTREALLKGGDSGPALVPGNPKKSLLIAGIRHDDPDPDMAMPPKKDKLPDAVIADFEEWIRMGAPDPRSGKATAKASWDAKAKDHWAFQPISHPAVPHPNDAKKFIQQPVDAFILAKLREKGLEPAGRAEARALIRRVTYDLTGLPPTPAEVEAFVADHSPEAWEKVVDRLLASPSYGERWGRHWLDVARFADTSGDRNAGGKRPPIYPHAWTYRDYVIDAFNRDVPYNQFIIEQIAADRLPDAAEHKSRLAALGFLTVGKRFMGNENDVLDDRIDVVTKGLMGLTAACARCHDHKFDPIPTKDYYSLHGIFNSSQEPVEQPALSDPEKNPAYADYKAEVARIEEEAVTYRKTSAARLVAGMLEKAGDYLLLVHEFGPAGEAGKKADKLRMAARDRGLDAELSVVWKDRFTGLQGKEKDPVFGPWMRFAALPAEGFAAKAGELAAEISHSPELNPALAQEFADQHPATLQEVAAIYTRAFGKLHDLLKLEAYVPYKGGKRGPFDLAKTQTVLTDANEEALRRYVFGNESPMFPDDKSMTRALGNGFTNGENLIRSKQVNIDLSHPGAPKRAMTLEDKPTPKDSAVLVRGEPGNRGTIVPRQFLSLLAGENRTPVTSGSGRLELAQAIARRENPLTARVIVNRVWQWHFGQAIVRTVSDFGTRSEPPSHQELLDWMATWFMDHDWSLKKLHKLILTSSTYQESSLSNPKNYQTDPTNLWLAHFNVQRLDLEEIRDTFLTVGAQLDTAMGGPPFLLGGASASMKGRYGVPDLSGSTSRPNRRTVYAMVDRAGLQEMFNTFDFANPDMSTGERVLTTVPQQALFMMNSPFVIEQVKNLLGRADFPKTGNDFQKVCFIFRTAFQRMPRPDEIEIAQAFLRGNAEAPPTTSGDAAPPAEADANDPEAVKARARKAIAAKAAQPVTPLSLWEQYTQVVLLTNELVFVN